MADSVPGNVSSTVDVQVGTTFLGTIETRGDHDWFRVTLTAGQRYSFATSFGGSSTIDTLLTLRDATGAAVASDDDSGPNSYSLIGYLAPASGVYFLDVGTFNDATTGGYRVAISSTANPPGDLVAGDASTSATIEIGGTVSGVIDAIGDHDWYRVTLNAGQSYQIRTLATGGAGDPDTTISLRDASGKELGFNDDGDTGTYSALRYTPTTTGTYYIDIAAYGEAETGAFKLTLAEAPPLTVWTNDQIAYQLTTGYWGGTARHFNVTTGGTLTYNITGLTDAAAALAREAFAEWSDATGISFVPVTGSAQIVVDDNEDGAFTSATVSNGIVTSARVNVGTDWTTMYGTSFNSYGFQSFVHEIGHALGLGHAGNYNSEATYPQDVLYLNDNWGASIMSYFSENQNTYIKGLGFTAQYQQTPTAADDLAVSNLYGVETTTRTGNTVYGVGNTTGRVAYDITVASPGGYVLVDAGGVDTFDVSGYSVAQLINLTPESYSNIGGKVGNVSIARGTIIENAIGGSGNDTLIGNDAANILTGGGGADTLSGLAGNDTYQVDNAGDVVLEAAGGGTDTVFAIGSYTLSAQAEIETLSTASNAGISAAVLIGNGFSQTIIGDYGNNTLSDGGLVAGPGDVLIGLKGDDVYVVNSPRTFVIEGPGEGNDVVLVSALGSNFVLNANTSVETLRAVAGTEPINITGNPDSQRIEGNDGANILSSGSGAGDTLVGGLGDDTYRVFGGLDTIIEAAGQGNDRVFVSGNSFALNAGASVEYISTSVQADTGAFYLVGNEVGQVIVGNYGDNILDGNGGTSGNGDILVGLFGNDTYRVYGRADQVTELAGQGTDTVLTSASYKLGDTSVEVLSAENQSATGADVQFMLQGNALAQTIIGNNAANTLEGGGGADTLIGRGGDDLFMFIRNGADAGGVVTIQDFSPGDRIGLGIGYFPTANGGGITADNFVFGTAARDSDDRILYDQPTGRLFYDGDGNGAGAAILFALVTPGTALGPSDFIYPPLQQFL